MTVELPTLAPFFMPLVTGPGLTALSSEALPQTFMRLTGMLMSGMLTSMSSIIGQTGNSGLEPLDLESQFQLQQRSQELPWMTTMSQFLLMRPFCTYHLKM